MPTTVSLALSSSLYQSRLGLRKLDASMVAFTQTGLATLDLRAGTGISAPFGMAFFPTQTAITMPSHAAGTDYAIYLLDNGTLIASANFTAPAGYTTANSYRIGGYHFAPGGNATAQAGGDSTPQINPYSLWDLSFRPACPDPRGMALISNSFWADIYLTNTATDTLGTSAYGVNIADGATLAKIPARFGGNGSTTYGDHNWWTAGEIAASAGKQLPTYHEFAALAYGVTEGTSIGSEPSLTTLDAPRTSRWGIMQAAGNMWIWGLELNFSNGANGDGWRNVTGGRGNAYLRNDEGLKAALYSANWVDSSSAGSRASCWSYSPWVSYNLIGSRFRCDHLLLP